MQRRLDSKVTHLITTETAGVSSRSGRGKGGKGGGGGGGGGGGEWKGERKRGKDGGRSGVQIRQKSCLNKGR